MNETETLADIVRMLRRDADIVEERHVEDTWSGFEAAGIYRDLADRIEAAAERERDAVKASAGMSCELCERLGPARFVYAAAMRAALKALIAYWDWNGFDALRESQLKDIARAALAAPARNADRFSDPGKAWLAYKAECDKDETVPNMIGAISWLFAPAEGEVK